MGASTLTGREQVIDQWRYHILSPRGDWGQLPWENVIVFPTRPMVGRRKERKHGYEQDAAERTGAQEEAEADRDGTPRHRDGAGHQG